MYTQQVPKVTVGSVVQVGGTVAEYAPSSTDHALTITEIIVDSYTGGYYTPCPNLYQDSQVSAVILSKEGRLPPNRYIYKSEGCKQIDINELCSDGTSCPTLDVEYGLDFWESLEGMVVSIPRPIVSGFDDKYDKPWVLGNEGKDSSSKTS